MTGQIRTCAGCGKKRPKHEMIRVGHEPDSGFTVGETGKVPGRGAYLCRAGSCADSARRRRSLDRALRAGVPESVYVSIEGLCEERE